MVVGCVMLSLQAGVGAADVEPNSPYHQIAIRNVFDLKNPPAPARPPKPEIVLPKIRLTLITTIFSDKRAGLVWSAAATRPGEPPREESHILRVGDAEAGVEVLEIDEVKGQVKIRNQGQLQSLTFTSNSTSPTAGPVVLK